VEKQIVHKDSKAESFKLGGRKLPIIIF